MNTNDHKSQHKKLASDLYHQKKYLADEQKRKEAIDFFEKNDFPTRKTEDWRHTDISPLLSHDYKNAEIQSIDKKTVSKYKLPELEAHVLVFVNGHFNRELSGFDSQSIKTGNISALRDKKCFSDCFDKTGITEDNVFIAMNTAFSQDGYFIEIQKNASLEKPVHIINLLQGNEKPAIALQRNLIIGRNGSRANVIETYHSIENETVVFDNVVTEIFTESNAKLNFNLYQAINRQSYLLHHTKVCQRRDSKFSSHTYTFSGKIVRNNLNVYFSNENCEANLYGLYLVDKEQHFDNFTYINHAKPHCRSEQIYKGIAEDKASAVFFGKVYVAKDAQKTDANQSNQNILLSNDAKVNSKPQLEIYADDVSCTHGSTVGQMDKEALFYMQTRGLPEKKAKILLLNAFASEIINRTEIEALQSKINDLVAQHFEQ